MTTVDTTVEISINPNVTNMEALEAEIGEDLQQAGRDLLMQACEVVETQILEEAAGLQRSKRRGLHMLTRFGWIRLSHWQVRDAHGRYFCPLDNVLGLQPRQHASPWITEKSIALATRVLTLRPARVPYRQAAYLPGDFFGRRN